MSTLLALGPVAAWGLVDWLICIIIVLAILAVGSIVLRQIGYTIPPWVWQILGILVAVIVGIAVIKFLAGLA